MIDKIKRLFSYFFRDELDKKHKTINTLLIAAVLIQIPCTVITYVVDTDSLGCIIQLFLSIVIISELAFVNIFHISKIPESVLAYLVNLFLLPLMYFYGGGRNTGIIIWMGFGNVLMWLILEGVVKVVGIVLNYITVGACLWIEMTSYETIKHLNSDIKENADVYMAYVLMTMVLGAVIRYLIYGYEKQTQELAQKEKSLIEANTNLELINIGLEQASLAKSSFLASMSHEIRTPINAILGMDEMIIRESDDETILSYANDIDAAGHQLLSIINDILDFSKIESGKLEIHPVEYELFSIMNDCYNMSYFRAKKKDLKIILENEPSLPAILYGDEVRIRQIIMNLMSNAIKYTRDGYVKISFDYQKIDAENIELIIVVKDTGIGISEENLPHLFEEFRRFDEVNNRSVEGTGLGLTITKQLVNLMDGRVEVSSVLGEGTVFTVSIPQRIANHGEVVGDFSQRYRHKEHLEEITADNKKSNKDTVERADAVYVGEDEITGASSLKKPDSKKNKASFSAPDARILVVDDVKMNLNVVRLLLKGTDIQVDLASSGEEALKYTMLKKYDVIFMDHMMPGMDGIEAFHKVQNQSMGLNNDTPVIVLTANAIQSVEKQYMQEGFVSYVSKPVKGEKLERELIRFLPSDKVVLNNDVEA